MWIYSKHKSGSQSNGYAGGAIAFLPGGWSAAGGMLDSEKQESSSKAVSLKLVFDRKKKKLGSYQSTKVRI